MILAIEWPHHSGEDQNRSDTIEIVRVAVSSLHAEARPTQMPAKHPCPPSCRASGFVQERNSGLADAINPG
jgi:hypothetical protein